MISNHTPGPWEWQGNSLISKAPGLNYGSRYVIEVHDGTIYSEYSADGASLDCTVENARLIAAAPDLYAALVRAREAIEFAREQSGFAQPSTLAFIDAALAMCEP